MLLGKMHPATTSGSLVPVPNLDTDLGEPHLFTEPGVQNTLYTAAASEGTISSHRSGEAEAPRRGVACSGLHS